MATLNDATISSVRDLADAIDAFLTANGFVQETAPNGTSSGDAAWSAATGNGELYVQIAWDAQSHFDIYQSTSDDGSAPGSNPGDSGIVNEVLFNGLNLTNAELWGFTNGDTASDDSEIYAHFVLEHNRDGRYVHFGFGHVEKYSVWDGGAYSYGYEWSTAGNNEEEPWNTAHRLLLDGNHTSINSAGNPPKMTIRNMDGQPASGDWGILTNSTSTLSLNDTDGNGVMKCEGYVRHGPWPMFLLHLRGNPNNGFIPLIPVEVSAHVTLGSSGQRYMLGRMRDAFVCNIGNIQPKAQLTIGGETYQFFPWAQKILDAGTDEVASRNAGVAYRVLT